MNPILTIRASEAVNLLMAKTSALLNDAEQAKLYASISAVDITAAELAQALSAKYRELITLTAADTTLHAVVVIPLFDPEFGATLSKISEAVRIVPDRISIHILALRNNIARVLGHSLPEDADTLERNNVASLDTTAEKERISYSILDDYVESGAPLDFTLNSLAEYLSFMISALMCDYHKILPSQLLYGNEDRNIAIGISNYSFNRKGACELLLHKAFLYALEKDGVGQETVDSQKCLSYATALLAGIGRRYRSFYESTVEPIYKKGELSDGDIAGLIGEPLKTEMKDIEDTLLSFITESSLTLPEKEGILALILGRDNARLQGAQYDQETLIVNDVCNTPLDLYISTFNSLPPDSPARSSLPIRGNYDRLKKWEFDEETGKRSESPDNSKAFNPLPAIKKLKREILDTTSFIRRKTDQLRQLEDLDRQRIEVEHQDKKYVVPLSPKQSEIKEQPLEDVYVPPAKLKIKDSVDLREFFSEVRNQGNLGSCSTFAVVSMYEAIMNRAANRTVGNKANMSEQFVYHYSNVIKGHPEGGSNYYDQLKVLGTNGVCEETLFGYTSGNLGTEPPQIAVEDAQLHRVLKAKEIRLENTSDKLETITRNHRLLTSALTEGYPVGIALKLFESFGNDGPFINRPTDSDVARDEHSNHAMVIVGYSEERKCYIVRNSWGEDFGDKGYCYISSSYIDDPDFNFFSCIITETTEPESGEIVDPPALVAPFAGTQTQIEIAEIRNVLDEVVLMLESLQQRYDEYYRYYTALIQRLCIPQTRNLLREEAERECYERLQDIQSEKIKLENSFIDIFKEYKRNLLIRALKVSAGALGFTLVSGLICSAGDWMPYGVKLGSVICAALMIIIAIYCWIDKISKQRKKRVELKESIKNLAISEDRVRRELFEKHLQYHVAGMWIDSYHDLRISLDKTYNRLQSFNNSLRVWMEEDGRAIAEYQRPEGAMFIAADNPELLKKYFEANVIELVKNIDLIDTFRNYAVDSETIRDARNRLNNQIRGEVAKMFENFRIYDHLAGIIDYPYMKKERIEELIGRMINLGQPATRHSAGAINFPVRLMLVALRNDGEIHKWNDTVSRHFPSHVDLINISDPDALTLLTIRPLPASAMR